MNESFLYISDSHHCNTQKSKISFWFSAATWGWHNRVSLASLKNQRPNGLPKMKKIRTQNDRESMNFNQTWMLVQRHLDRWVQFCLMSVRHGSRLYSRNSKKIILKSWPRFWKWNVRIKQFIRHPIRCLLGHKHVVLTMLKLCKLYILNVIYSNRIQNRKFRILGQDPYHGPKQAHGLCFSVQVRWKILIYGGDLFN